MEYRIATKKDIPVLVELRKAQLIDEGLDPNPNIDIEMSNFFHEFIEKGTLIQWVIEEQQEIVATAAIIFYTFPPSFDNPINIKGYIANVYTKPSHRKQGLSTKLLTKVCLEAKKRNIKTVWLGASEMGKPVYTKFGFKENDCYLEIDTSIIEE